jgi:hypothetical protein
MGGEGPQPTADGLMDHAFRPKGHASLSCIAARPRGTGLGLSHSPEADLTRASALARCAYLTYDAVEAVRPCVDGWLAAWLVETRFSKRDFHEESDGTVRITRPLTSHLAMTAPIWRPAAQAVAG